MNSDRDPGRYNAPTEAYTTMPTGPTVRADNASQAPYSNPKEQDDRHHPLHKVYRRRMRGVRVRWFGSGFIGGLLTGVLVTLILSAVIVTQVPGVAQSLAGDPDLTVAIGERYLNRVAADRIKGSYATGVSGLTLTSLNINLTSQNRMDLQPTFQIDAGFMSFSINATVKNQLSVQNGQVSLKMVGDPQLGNLNVPLDILPFDLKGSIASSIDHINNDLLISEINKSLQSSYGGSSFTVQDVSTTEDSMVIKLQSK
ncbi:MAG: hypothetical protein M3014_06695 [Chloroflexota bacterium]|nr:hypothetical protein [Chloroflexota bacterium]